jgi:hypothetical protein
MAVVWLRFFDRKDTSKFYISTSPSKDIRIVKRHRNTTTPSETNTAMNPEEMVCMK